MLKNLQFSFVVLTASALLFVAEPLVGKLVLPRVGGAAAGWNTCMAVFQLALLAGYALAHWGPRWLGMRGYALVHLGLFLPACFLLPFRPPEPFEPGDPTIELALYLARSIGLPFTLLTSTGILLQRWHAQTPGDRDPYFLYSASNLGSLVGLISYPFFIEPDLTLKEQSQIWWVSFLALGGLLIPCAWRLRHAEPDTSIASAPIRWRVCLRWMLLAMVPSSLLMSVTRTITEDLAPIPLLWIAALGLYLITFILAFARWQIVPHRVILRAMPIATAVILFVMLAEAQEPWLVILGVHLLGFFVIALGCHGELAQTRPAPGRLSEFYLWIALGGAIGGLFNSIVAPQIFTSLAEYPWMLILACALKPGKRGMTDLIGAVLVGSITVLLVRYGSHWQPPGARAAVALFGPGLFLALLLSDRPMSYALSLAALWLASTSYLGVHGQGVLKVRSFFGCHRVTVGDGFRKLIHNSTVHGLQSLDPKRLREPLAYYTQSGPIGQVMHILEGDPRLERVGLVGLGAGALASYAPKGSQWTFFEIDPAIVQLAQDPTIFSYLALSRGDVAVELGDARRSLELTKEKFGLLVLDAFGSDSIPVHLLTREAFELYFDRLQPGGILAVHISNRYLDLEPMLAKQARDLGLVSLIGEDLEPSDFEKLRGKSPSVWMVFAKKATELERLNTTPRWRFPRERPGVPAWTDDFSNLLEVIRR